MLYRALDFFSRDGPTRLRRNLRLSTSEAGLASALVYINVGGNFIVAALVTQVFGIDNRIYGWMASMPAWCSALQMALVPWLAKRWSSRDLAVGGALLSATAWAVFTMALPWLPREEARVTALAMFAVITMGSLTQSFASVGYTSWIQDWLPARIRGKYIGFRNRISSLVTVTFFLFVGGITEAFTHGVWAFQVIFGVAAIGRLIGVTWQIMMRTPPPAESQLRYIGWTGQLKRLAEEKSFMRFATYSAVAAFVMNLAGPFYPVFSYEQLHLRVDEYSLLVLLATVGAAVTWPWWGQFTDRHGCRNAIKLSLCCWSFTDLWWPFLQPGHAMWPLYFMWLWGGASNCGFYVGSFNWLLKLVPPQARVAGVSLNLAMSSLAAAVAPIVSGTILQMAHEAGPAQTDLVFRAILFAKPVMMLGALILLRNVVEPAGGPFESLLGAMRAQRQVLVTQYLPFLANVSSARPGSGQDARRKPGKAPWEKR